MDPSSSNPTGSPALLDAPRSQAGALNAMDLRQSSSEPVEWPSGGALIALESLCCPWFVLGQTGLDFLGQLLVLGSYRGVRGGCV